MVVRSEDPIEKFIRENKDEFGNYAPHENHMGKFLTKLNQRIRHIINIVPYLIKVAVATILIFTLSVIVWNNFLRRDREVLTLKYKIVLIIDRIVN
jgi:hypothetical protein